MRRKKAGSAASSPAPSKARKPWVDPDDAPEITDDMLAGAELRVGDKVVRRGRPPLGATAKSSVTLRLDTEVLTAYRGTGAGWQTRINSDLRRAARKLRKA
jgi:uncharacterized protein (DUF4415 family)